MIDLKGGITTPGKFATNKRIDRLSAIDFAGKTVLDIGCNSGQYCLFAKKSGARKVVGVDPSEHRIQQARVLANYEELEIDFRVGDISSVANMDVFDIVICIAVLTEIQDVIGGLSIIRDATRELAFIELGLAKPLIYISSNSRWLRSKIKMPSHRNIGEFFKHKHAGWVLFPSVDVVSEIFGDDFELKYEGRQLRYDLVVLHRLMR